MSSWGLTRKRQGVGRSVRGENLTKLGRERDFISVLLNCSNSRKSTLTV
jgi:hypothetical protein